MWRWPCAWPLQAPLTPRPPRYAVRPRAGDAGGTVRVTSSTEIWIAASRMRSAFVMGDVLLRLPAIDEGQLEIWRAVMSRRASRHCERSEAPSRAGCFVAMAPRNDDHSEIIPRSHARRRRCRRAACDAQMQARLRRAEIGDLVGHCIERLRCGAGDAADDTTLPAENHRAGTPSPSSPSGTSAFQPSPSMTRAPDPAEIATPSGLRTAFTCTGASGSSALRSGCQPSARRLDGIVMAATIADDAAATTAVRVRRSPRAIGTQASVEHHERRTNRQ